MVQSLIITGIVAVTIAGSAALLYQQQRQNHALAEKMSILEAEDFYTTGLLDGVACTYALNNPPQTIDLYQFGNPNYGFSFQTFPASDDPNGASLATTNQPANANGDQRLVVSTIKINNFAAIPGYADYVQAQFQVGFDNSQLQMSRQPAKVNLLFRLDPASPPSNKIVVSCQSYVGAPPVPTPCFWLDYGTQAQNVCPVGYYVAGLNSYVGSFSIWSGLYPGTALVCCPVVR